MARSSAQSASPATPKIATRNPPSTAFMPRVSRPTRIAAAWAARSACCRRISTIQKNQSDIMKIGLFDHVEHGERPLTTLFDERLRFADAADAAGFYCLHVAEHHATPLNLVPVPGIYLAAIARKTKRLRFGPLVYLLPLYSPLRLIEEICMIHHLCPGP